MRSSSVVFSVEHFSCPCGASTYRIVTRSGVQTDDWIMDCPTCQKTYALCKESFALRVKGDLWKGNSWVPAPLYRCFRDVRRNKVQLWREMVDLFAVRYSALWDAKMRSLPFKKARHEALGGMNLYVGSLETFYRHGGDHNCVFSEVHTFSSIPAMMRFLEVTDKELDTLFDALDELEHLLESLQAKVVAARRR